MKPGKIWVPFYQELHKPSACFTEILPELGPLPNNKEGGDTSDQETGSWCLLLDLY